MSLTQQREYWLRGPVEDVPPLLQPVAHALLQAGDEVAKAMQHFPQDKLWVKPAALASAGFHLQHLRGVLDRLFTYAKGESLSQQQLAALSAEGTPYEGNNTVGELVNAFQHQIALSVGQLRSTKEATLTDKRGVGRAQLPSTVIGLLFHAAEHTMRHTGQLLVTATIVAKNKDL